MHKENQTVSNSDGRARILVVDHDSSGRELLRRILEASGYEVVTAMSAKDAIRRFDEHRIDLVVSEVGLPDIDGRDLMRALCAKRPVPGLAFSGRAMPRDYVLSREAGFAEHLAKPADLDGVLDAVAR